MNIYLPLRERNDPRIIGGYITRWPSVAYAVSGRRLFWSRLHEVTHSPHNLITKEGRKQEKKQQQRSYLCYYCKKGKTYWALNKPLCGHQPLSSEESGPVYPPFWGGRGKPRCQLVTILVVLSYSAKRVPDCQVPRQECVDHSFSFPWPW